MSGASHSTIPYRVAPVGTWPGARPRERRRSQFRGSVQSTFSLLGRELHHLRATNVVVRLDVLPGQVRLDGRLRADARVASPDLIVEFDTPRGHMVFPAATYAHWDCNLRAVALTLEHLRAVDRYGVTTGGEQYRGWMGELGAGPATGLGRFTRTTGAEWMAHALNGCGVPIDDVNIVLASPRSMYRTLARHLHPDHGGSDDDMATLNAAYQAITGAPAAAGDHVSVTGSAP